MLRSALKLLTQELQQHLSHRLDASAHLVALAAMPDILDVDIRAPYSEKILVYLVNTQEDEGTRTRSPPLSNTSEKNTPLSLNLSVLVAANFSSYESTLR